jgi:hypothetical protein
VRLWRTVPLDRSAAADAPGGPLWFPREQQGQGRHDNPGRYGCLYASEDAVSAVAESLVAFRGTGRLTASMLTRLGRPLALAELALPDDVIVIDLDDPDVLAARHLHPSWVASRDRELTQSIAWDLYGFDKLEARALRWWSTIDSRFANWTLFDIVAESLELIDVTELRLDDPAVREAAVLLGLMP